MVAVSLTETPSTKRTPFWRRPSINTLRRTRRQLWQLLLSVGVLFTAWFFLAPPVLGGGTSVAVATGVSMLPHFHAGDLVIVRKEPRYHVGEVAAYHNGDLHVVVMHRIIAIRDGHYVFKGDNNNFTDSYEPTKSQIVGAEWITVAGGGNWLRDLRRPGVAAVVLALLWVLSFSPKPGARRRKQGGNENRSDDSSNGDVALVASSDAAQGSGSE